MIDSDKIKQAADLMRSMDAETRDAFARNLVRGVMMAARMQDTVAVTIGELIGLLGIVVVMFDGANGQGSMKLSYGIADNADAKAGREIVRPVNQIATMLATVCNLIMQGKHVAVVEVSSEAVEVVTPQTPPIQDPSGGGN